MELGFNSDPAFTKWVVGKGLLHEKFVLVDIGVFGGENPGWDVLGDHLLVHGFDAGKEAIDALSRRKGGDRAQYHWCAIGNEDGERDFFVNPDDPTQSSFSRPGTNCSADGKGRYETRRVPVRSLDSLLTAGEIPAPDFLKVDVEGSEKQVLHGAARCLSERLLGIETETNFNASPDYPNTHIGLVQECIVPHGFQMFDLNFHRAPRASFENAQQARGLRRLAYHQTSRPSSFNVLFCRDLAAEAAGLQFPVATRSPRNADEIIKAMVILELYRLTDVAFDTARRLAGDLGTRLDVDKACSLLVESGRSVASTAESFEEALASEADLRRKIYEMRSSPSWRLTAPLRWLKRRLVR